MAINMKFYGFDYLVNEHQRVFWLYILSSMLIAAIYIYIFDTKKREIFSKSIWLHKSAKLDYIYFFLSSIVKVILLAPLIIGTSAVASWTLVQMQNYIGYVEFIRLNRGVIILLYTLLVFLVSDFTRYLLHRLMHNVEFLWKFHKVHHSAEVLNPLTFYRVHFVENILFSIRYALSIGLLSGIFLYFFGARVGIIDILGVNIFVFIFSLIGSNLRHSHVQIRFGKKMERWVISPYMHQYHHSIDGLNKNFGGSLAIWDRVFKTLHNEKSKSLKFGIKDESRYRTILSLFIQPFKELKNG